MWLLLLVVGWLIWKAWTNDGPFGDFARMLGVYWGVLLLKFGLIAALLIAGFGWLLSNASAPSLTADQAPLPPASCQTYACKEQRADATLSPEARREIRERINAEHADL